MCLAGGRPAAGSSARRSPQPAVDAREDTVQRPGHPHSGPRRRDPQCAPGLRRGGPFSRGVSPPSRPATGRGSGPRAGGGRPAPTTRSTLRVETPLTKASITTDTSARSLRVQRLEEAREVAAGPELRDEELERAGARIPAALAVAVSLGRARLGGALAVAGADLGRHLGLHDLVAEEAHRLPDQVGVLVGEHLAHQRVGAHGVGVGHRGAPSTRSIGVNRGFGA
ncbi:MAG: hypothetical protein QOK40_223, partial [Miltoncostaeaceae bacterium]|nr:hypothetical protein [Miltoncostaeaceae bacterium]